VIRTRLSDRPRGGAFRSTTGRYAHAQTTAVRRRGAGAAGTGRTRRREATPAVLRRRGAATEGGVLRLGHGRRRREGRGHIQNERRRSGCRHYGGPGRQVEGQPQNRSGRRTV